MQPSNLAILDVLYIQSCSNEIQLRGIKAGLDPEDKEGRRLDSTKEKTVAVRCSNKNVHKQLKDGKKEETKKNLEICSYNKKITYWPYRWNKLCGEISTLDFWNDLLQNIENVVAYIKPQRDVTQTKLMFVVVSHHKRMRELILPVREPEKGQKKTGFGYASAVTLASVVTNEFQDTSIDVTWNGEETTISSEYEFVDEHADMWNDILDYSTASFWPSNVFERLQKIAPMVEIVVCRPGESLHNVNGQFKRLGRYPLDSSLTETGKKQADALGIALAATITSPTIVVPIASYLNRSQHTALRCVASMAQQLQYDFKNNPNHVDLLEKFDRESGDRQNRLSGLQGGERSRTNKN